MSDKTGISWTDATWNPVRGCSRVSEGCRHCYAERVAARFSGPGQPYEGLVRIRTRAGGQPHPDGWSGVVRLVPEHLADPLRWKKPRRIFVNSMSDVFHEALTNEQIAAVFGVMAAAPQHTFQVLTKRARRMREWFEWAGDLECDPWTECHAHALGVEAQYSDGGPIHSRSDDRHGRPWPLPNVWLGVSVENQDAANERIPELLAAPAAVRFLSCEPLLGPVDLSQWLGDADAKDQASRGSGTHGHLVGRTGDRLGGPRLEGGCAPLGSMDEDDSRDSMRATTGGERERDRLPAGADDDRRRALSRAGASSRVAPCERSDSGRDDDQPQERHEVGQPDREPRARDGLAAADSREPGARDRRGREPDGRAQSVRKADRPTGTRDPSGPAPRRETRDDREAIRGDVSAHLRGGARSQSISWIISGCESGHGARPCAVSWLTSLRDQCADAGVPFFLKQAHPWVWVAGERAPGHVDDDGRGAISAGPGSKRKAGGVIELPYLDGVQHKDFPNANR